MTTPADDFDVLGSEYEAWQKHTQALLSRRDRDKPTSRFELELDHLIDYLRPIFAAAAKRSTQFDYSRLAEQYLRDLDETGALLENAETGSADRRLYLGYLVECRGLLNLLGSLPVPSEGHLGFRRSALQAFHFLTEKYAFRAVETSPISVRYATEALFVDVSHSPQCPMNSIVVGKRIGHDTSPSGFILDDFAYAAGLGILFNYEQFDLLDPSSIAKFLQTASSVVLASGDLLLRGDEEAFREFQSKADEREQAFVEMMGRQASIGD